ncbi:MULTISPECIES: 5-formyltetrahydrofolate cyclo-ligase [unclassified Nitratiruptor]|uniref:5-formyltetrahydrofolate cyclo-ligase n=1 Tax=unclassified Nitratiruptor TaxID=2624044 RepID=UPI0019165EC6|nr:MULTISPECIES: 5-formyltetrahydrofolate cyclo-ligase [unclassified Nitratiruptor]BCD60230.1 5-formyltetrahydrofolate cyclo-ligase [Nitratiruptor sp. YY08-10]BCD64281.1 5-formyltetrahydrofolate cyclo-ligase [Nitratiruptor sp. YY08-14]
MSSPKERFRNRCKEKLLQKPVSRKLHKMLQANLQFILDALNPNNMLVFMPMAHEPDLLGFFAHLRRKKNIFVPFMQGQSFKMVKFRLPIKRGKFGIKEPSNSFFETKIDIVLIPVIGVDGDFRRIGFGKGMYDRFMAALPYQPIVIFVQTKECLIKERICDTYDVRGDFLITPKKIYIRGDSDVGRDFSRKFCSNHKRRCRIFTVEKN